MDYRKVVNDIIKESNVSLDIIVNRNEVISFVNEVRTILFLGYYEKIKVNLTEYITNKIDNIYCLLKKIINSVQNNNVDNITTQFINYIPIIKKQLNGDLSAFLLSDPAVYSEQEVIVSYPGFYAISLYRIANYLNKINVKVIPRIITEHAHSKTGIDINPCATIGDNFFIDHGTGIVIGETTNIGNNVKIYQGVTLGAISLEKVELVKNTKRHPTIEDNVTIYSNTSILGGKTVIGNNSIIGSNLFIVKTVEPNSKIVFNNNSNN